MLKDAVTYGRFLTGLPGFVRNRIDPREARDLVTRRLENRDENFLSLLRRGTFTHPGSPYGRLMELAGCERGDLESLVRERGLHDALSELRRGGVYITFEEFKGRSPLVRHGVEIPLRSDSFDNPFLSRYYHQATGGTTGASRQASMDIDYLFDSAIDRAAFDPIMGLAEGPMALWMCGLPGPGLAHALMRAAYGQAPRRWFSSMVAGPHRPPRKFRWAEKGMLWTTRLAGAGIPFPEQVTAGEADIPARWLAAALEREGKAIMYSGVSDAFRVALAAQKLGIDLTGAMMYVGGEPPTPAKVEAIKATGAQFRPSYAFTEAGAIGLACPDPAHFDELHFLAHKLELIQAPRAVGEERHIVESFYFTSLLDTAPKLLLNVEIDDYGEVFERACGCGFEEMGFHRHLRQIRSFSKLTGEGVTLVGTDMIRILDTVLPARFGGTPLDYQLIEEEDEQGFTRLNIIVAPGVHLADESEVVDVMLDALARGQADAVISQRIWKQASTIRVRRITPIATSRGKLFPLHVVSGRGAADDSGTRSDRRFAEVQAS